MIIVARRIVARIVDYRCFCANIDNTIKKDQVYSHSTQKTAQQVFGGFHGAPVPLID